MFRTERWNREQKKSNYDDNKDEKKNYDLKRNLFELL